MEADLVGERILKEAFEETREKMANTINVSRELGIFSISINKIEPIFLEILKKSFNAVSCRNGMGPIVE